MANLTGASGKGLAERDEDVLEVVFGARICTCPNTTDLVDPCVHERWLLEQRAESTPCLGDSEPFFQFNQQVKEEKDSMIWTDRYITPRLHDENQYYNVACEKSRRAGSSKASGTTNGGRQS